MLGFILLFTIACKKDSLSKDNHEVLSGWITMKAKSQMLYRVDSIAFRRDKSIPDTFTFDYLELVDTVFYDNSNEQVARIKIMTRLDSLDFWKYRRMYYAKITHEFYERVEENTRLLKLSFPPAEDAFWNLNSRNNMPPLMLSYRNLYEPYKGAFVKSDTSLTILGKEISNALEQFRYVEVYGKGIGLMYGEKITMLNQGGNWDGYKRIQKLIYAN